ncbi:hypothetical protein D7W82_07860 [Corallococcus sp. CA049B]|uniref:hypothetical protein n=1 Tax=Corallococcus sp. CA049B TaxID=2316730 RepID=UPI000EA112A0|nr:hypothetical protein [Corallococcus sp. CA049B]NOJ94483.1 hypothetical protein [Corallococcus coralloides]RKG89173.1 hypothetical protein D7W82_07860 [Corallococcus sp. CA049B]
MDTARLRELGLLVREEPSGVEVVLDLEAASLVNPITKDFITEITFQGMGDRLIPISPPAVVGMAPILLSAIDAAEEMQALLLDTFSDHVFHLQRRSEELQLLGLPADVDPQSLVLSTDVKEGQLAVKLVADRQGNFRIAQAIRGREELVTAAGHVIELSEFREKAALTGYLSALLGEPVARAPQATSGAEPVRFVEIVEKFGPQSLVPPRSSLELLAQLQVEGKAYRFAAARIAGRTFRGLLAGTQGKVWAGRFELDEFPGVVQLVAELLKVAPEAVRLVGPDAPQE